MTQIPQRVRVVKTIRSGSQPRPGQRALTREDIVLPDPGHGGQATRSGPQCPLLSSFACSLPVSRCHRQYPGFHVCRSLSPPPVVPISGMRLLPVAVCLTYICLSCSLVSWEVVLFAFVLSKTLKPHSLSLFSYLININSGTRKGFYLRITINI